MSKMSAILLLCCMLTATSALAAEAVTTKTVYSPLQQVKFTTQKNMVSQAGGISTSLNTPFNSALREKVMMQDGNTEATSTTAKIGLLATALLCFVVRSSRRKV